jgi:hypothetical protein
MVDRLIMANWNLLTSHARMLMCIAHAPGTRLRDIAARLDITERSAHGIVTDLTAAGYLVKQKDGRRNRRRCQGHSHQPGHLPRLRHRPRLDRGRIPALACHHP